MKNADKYRDLQAPLLENTNSSGLKQKKNSETMKTQLHNIIDRIEARVFSISGSDTGMVSGY